MVCRRRKTSQVLAVDLGIGVSQGCLSSLIIPRLARKLSKHTEARRPALSSVAGFCSKEGYFRSTLEGNPGNALRAFPGSFWNSSGISSGKSQPYWGYDPVLGSEYKGSREETQ